MLCENCDDNSECVDGDCVCRNNYTGNGTVCQEITCKFLLHKVKTIATVQFQMKLCVKGAQKMDYVKMANVNVSQSTQEMELYAQKVKVY